MIRTCKHCGSKNRVPARFLAAHGRCGTCKKTLAPLDEPVDVDATHFEEITGGATVPVLVDFWAPWCGPCRMAAPAVAKAAANLAGKARYNRVAAPPSGRTPANSSDHFSRSRREP